MTASYHQSLFPSQVKDGFPQRLFPDEWIRGRGFTGVLGTQDTGALVLLKDALCMMDGAYYLNANKY